MIDFSNQQTIEHDYDIDPVSGLVTVTFKDGSGTELGKVQIETARVRSLLSAVEIVLAELIPDQTLGLAKSRTEIHVVQGTAKTVF